MAQPSQTSGRTPSARIQSPKTAIKLCCSDARTITTRFRECAAPSKFPFLLQGYDPPQDPGKHTPSSGFWPFTRTVGGQTPCYSSLKTTARAPTLTAGLAGQPTDTSRPASAVVNIVWAMEYQVSSGGGGSGLSVGATAGIGVGAGVAGILILVLAFFLWRSRCLFLLSVVAAALVGLLLVLV